MGARVGILQLGLVAAMVLTACAPSAGSPRSASDPAARSAAPAPQRTLVIAIRAELPSLAAKPLVPFSMALNPPLYIFNAMLDYADEHEVSHPYLAEALPKLETDTWRVFPDGRMETTWHLRPNFALLDVRVRWAIASGIDSFLAVEVLTAGKSLPTYTLTSPRVPYYAEIERVAQKTLSTRGGSSSSWKRWGTSREPMASSPVETART